MRDGKISENVLKRSVLRQIKTDREELISGAGIGKDCAILALGDGMETVLCTTPVSAPADRVAGYAIPMALNNLAVVGASPVAVMLTVLLPSDAMEEELQSIMKQAQEVCESLGVAIAGGHTEVSPVVREPLVQVTGIGKKEAARAGYPQGIKEDQDIVVSKWIGLEGTARLARERKEELCTRYPVRMVEEAAGFDRYLSVIPEAATAMKSGVCGMHDVSRGGIFGALWEMASGAGVGLEIDLKKIPVKQETVEICEFFGINPYELLSGGCLIMVTQDGNGLVGELQRSQIPAVIIGRTTAGNDRILFNEEERRFLDMPKMDQIYAVGK
jgi:hydrogenase expression/formation protein HypE